MGNSLPRLLMIYICVSVIGTVIGFFSVVERWWIGDRMNDIRLSFMTVIGEFETPWYLDFPPSRVRVATHRPDRLAPGLVVVSGIGADRSIFVNVIDRQGNVVHGWQPDWFEIWPSAPDVILPKRRPQTRPGALPHGLQVLGDGSLMMNFENLSTVRLDACGRTIWKLANHGHHSIEPGPDGTFYISAENPIRKGEAVPYDNHYSAFADYTIDQIDADGNVLLSKPVLEILQQNNLTGLMFLKTLENFEIQVSGDTMHLNDIEMFPEGMESEVFAPGDLMISLRNINTILVVDPDTWKVKFQSTGPFLRQHDPDFAEGDRILVFDNRNLDPLVPENERYSRIVEIDALTGAHREYFRGQGAAHFYTAAMGKFQQASNGNLLITSSQQGRAIEVDPSGNLVWEFSNVISKDNNAVLMEAHLLPLSMDRAFFEGLREACEG